MTVGVVLVTSQVNGSTSLSLPVPADLGVGVQFIAATTSWRNDPLGLSGNAARFSPQSGWIAGFSSLGGDDSNLAFADQNQDRIVQPGDAGSTFVFNALNSGPFDADSAGVLIVLDTIAIPGSIYGSGPLRAGSTEVGSGASIKDGNLLTPIFTVTAGSLSDPTGSWTKYIDRTNANARRVGWYRNWTTGDTSQVTLTDTGSGAVGSWFGLQWGPRANRIHSFGIVIS